MVPGNTTKFFLVLSALVTSLYGWYRPHRYGRVAIHGHADGAAEDVVERMVTLIVACPMQTAVASLVLLWGLYRATAGQPFSPHRKK